MVAFDCQELVQCPLCPDLTSVENNDTVADIFDIAEEMTCHDYGLAAFFQHMNQVLDFTAAERVESGGGFVENQEGRVIDHCLGKPDTARHSFGKFSDGAVLCMGESDHFKQLFAPVSGVRARKD